MKKKDLLKDNEKTKTISMTGFGKGIIKTDILQIEIEVKSLNSRFLDYNFKIPRIYNQFEPVIRETIASFLNRGRIDVYIKRTPLGKATANVEFNRALFDSYMDVYSNLREEFGVEGPSYFEASIRDLLGRRDILDQIEEIEDPEEELVSLKQVLTEALEALSEMRLNEGIKIGEEILKHFNQLREVVEGISDIVGKSKESIREKLKERINKIPPEITIDETRFSAEVALLLDRADVTEELNRLKSHFSQFKNYLIKTPNGRKLEFLLQEFGREINTIGSKAQDAEVQTLVVSAKSEVEKLREQVLNLE